METMMSNVGRDSRGTRSNERHKRILTALADAPNGRVHVKELAAMLRVSQETIRRDLARLADQGLLMKVHGGAQRFQTAQESTFSQRLLLSRAEKTMIGREAAALMKPGDSAFVDAGSTTILFARELAGIAGLTIITNCVLVADDVANGNGMNNVILLGGTYRGEVQETVGPMVIEQIRRFHADHAILTIGAISGEGVFTDFDSDEAHVARAMLEQAGSTTVLVDSTKIGKTALVEVCTADDVARVVTDRPLSSTMEGLFEKAGVEVFVAGSVEDAVS
jgi:DeoR family transcriptional regulator, glycerol-3-phosphate regulon repressor